MNTKICSKCKLEKLLNEFHKGANGKKSSWCNKCRAIYYKNYCKNRGRKRINLDQRKRSARIKLKVITYYSKGKLCCECCGETEYKFLTLDHINGGGTWHRKHTGGGDKVYEYLYRENFPKGYQILCFNCNWGKHINKGICPHKQQLLQIFNNA